MGVLETIAKAVIQIGADTTGLDKSLTGMTGKVDKTFGAIKTIITGAAAYAVLRWTEGTIALGVAAEKSVAVFTNTMKTAAHAPDAVIDKLKKWAESQEKITGFDAEKLMDQMGVLAMKTGDAAQAQAQLETSMNLARGRGMDLAEAANMVSMATLGMTRTWKQLGLELDAGASKAAIMEAINKKVAGAAETYAKTSAGQLEILKQNYEVMRETLGQALLPIINALSTQLTPLIQHLTEYISAHMPEIQSAIGKMCTGIGWAFQTAGKIIGDVAAAIEDITGKVQVAIDWINRMRIANETRAATNASAGDDFNITGMLTPNPGTNSVGTPLNLMQGRGTINRGVTGVIGGRGNIVNGVSVGPDTYVPTTVDWGPTVSAATDAANKTAQAAKDAAAKIYQLNQELADKIYALTHTETENALHEIDVQSKAMLAAGQNKVLVATWVKDSKKVVLDKEVADQKAAADEVASKLKETNDTILADFKQKSDEYLSAVQDYKNKELDVRAAVTQMVINNYTVEKNTAIKSIETQRDNIINALDDTITARQGALSSALDSLNQGKTDAVNAINAERDATVDSLNDMLDARQTELSSTLDILEKEQDAAIKALENVMNKREDELTSTLDALNQEKAAVLGQYDAQIKALQDSHNKAQDKVTVAELRKNVIYAETAQERTDAQEALDQELADESFNTQLASLQDQQQAASDTFDAKTVAAEKAGDAEIQSLKDTLAVTKTSYAAMTLAAQDSGKAEIQSLKDTLTETQSSYTAKLATTNSYYDQTLAAATKAGNAEIQYLKNSLIATQKSFADQLDSMNTYYDTKLATANINAEAEKLLATMTSDEILKMLQDKLPEYAALGAQYGNALYADALAGQTAFLELINTPLPVAPTAPTVQVQANGMAPAGYPEGTIVETADGNYMITGVNQPTPSGYTSVPIVAGGGGTKHLNTYAEGGWVGLNGPEIALMGERGPERVVPAGQSIGDDRAILRRLDDLISAVMRVAPGVASAVNGMGRSM